VVDLVRTTKDVRAPKFGTLKGKILVSDPNWWKPLTDEEVAAFLNGSRGMRLLLDTETFLWAIESPERLSRKAMSALRNASAVREMSVISLSEIAIKLAIGKLTLRKNDVVQGIEDLGVRLLPYSSDHALCLFDLPSHHTDPFDRQMIAQALSENIPLVTGDETFGLYKGLKIIW
jgi:PIN domain nuclease of toxin-antitoxin system